MSELTKMIEARIERQAKDDVYDLKQRMRATYKGAMGISYHDDFTRLVDELIDAIVDEHIAPKLLPQRIDYYNEKFLSQLTNATEILARFVAEQS